MTALLGDGLLQAQLVTADRRVLAAFAVRSTPAVRGQQGSASHSQPAKRRADDAQRGSALLCYILHTIHLVKIL